MAKRLIPTPTTTCFVAESRRGKPCEDQDFGDTWRWDTEVAENFNEAIISGVGKVPDTMVL